MSKRAGSDWWKLHHADFWGSEAVCLMSNDTALAYVFLLGVQAIDGALPGSEAAVAALLPRRFLEPLAIWAELVALFPLGADGKRRNPRQADEILRVDEGRASERARWHERQELKRSSAGAPAEHQAHSGGASPLLSSSDSESSSSRKGKVRKGEPPPVPPSLDRPAVHEALTALAAARREQGHKARGPIGLSRLYAELLPLGPDGAVAAINHSIAAGYQGVFPAKNGNAPAQRDFAAEEDTRGRQAMLEGVRMAEERLRAKGKLNGTPV